MFTVSLTEVGDTTQPGLPGERRCARFVSEGFNRSLCCQVADPILSHYLCDTKSLAKAVVKLFVDPVCSIREMLVEKPGSRQSILEFDCDRRMAPILAVLTDPTCIGFALTRPSASGPRMAWLHLPGFYQLFLPDCSCM